MQKARGHRQSRLPQLGGGWFQVLFHSPRGVLFTFPSRYWCAIGRQGVFSLGGWALRIQAGFHVSRPTWAPENRSGRHMHGAVTRSGAASQRLALDPSRRYPGPATPGGMPPGLGSSAFARHYWRNHCCFPLLRVLRCFTSPGVASRAYFIRRGMAPCSGAPDCSIRKPADQRRHAPPRGLSQLAASFIASCRQGIRHPPVQPGRLKTTGHPSME